MSLDEYGTILYIDCSNYKEHILSYYISFPMSVEQFKNSLALQEEVSSYDEMTFLCRWQSSDELNWS